MLKHLFNNSVLSVIVTAAMAASASAAFAADKIRIACVGNSITAGSGINVNSEKYPQQLGTILGSGYEVKNFGWSGTTAQSAGNNPYIKVSHYQSALNYNPNLVVIKLGTNDSKDENWKEDSPERFTNDMQAIIDSFRALDSKPDIYLCLPLRCRYKDYGINEKNLHKIIPLIQELGKKNNVPVINLHTAFENKVGDDWQSLYGDGVHPNPKGARLLAECVADAILHGNLGPEEVWHGPDAHPNLVCMGGYRLWSGTVKDGEFYSDVLQTLMGDGARVFKVSIPHRTLLRKGTETADKSEPYSYVNDHNFNDNVLNNAPEIVTIDLGEKDACAWNWTHKDDLEADMQYIIDQLKIANPLVKAYVCLPARTKGDANTNRIDGALLRDEVIPAIRAAAEKLNLPVIDLSDAIAPEQYLGDNYRYNAEAHKVVGQKIYDAIKDVQSGIEDLYGENTSGEQVFLTPNPVNSGSFVKANLGDCTKAGVCVYNTAGQLMLTATVTDDAPAFTVSLPAGYYLWTVNGETSTSTGKLIVR